MDLTPLRFIEEPIQVLFDQPPAIEKKPPCPNGFIWREVTFHIVEMLAEWHDYDRRGRYARNMQPAHAATAARKGSWGVGQFYFRVRIEDGRVFDLYYDRAPKDVDTRKGAWFLYREMEQP
jgi:hypothetical protein